MVKISIVIGIVCILMLVSIPSVMSSQTSSDSSTKITMADQFIVRCSSPYVFAGFNLEYFHDMPETNLKSNLILPWKNLMEQIFIIILRLSQRYGSTEI